MKPRADPEGARGFRPLPGKSQVVTGFLGNSGMGPLEGTAPHFLREVRMALCQIIDDMTKKRKEIKPLSDFCLNSLEPRMEAYSIYISSPCGIELYHNPHG